MRNILWLILIVIFMIGCSVPDVPPTTSQPLVLPSPQRVPPTFTPGGQPVVPTLSPVPTRPPTLTAVPETPIPFKDTVIELRYRIPALDLDRRLQGNVSSQIMLVDETSGNEQQRNNQGGILLQLQAAIKDLALPPIPDGCDRCVQLSYALPLEGKSASGWLQDVTLLASVENFMAVALGPHFPSNTLVGLRRSASPYAPAQTLALLADGRLWVWQANQDTIPEALPADPLLVDALAQMDASGLNAVYAADCPGVAIETLFIGGENETEVGIACPDYTIPSTLMPLYVRLDSLMMTNLTDNLERPPTGFPLTALLEFERVDGAQLTLYADGTAVALDTGNLTYTSTISITQIISLTTSLIDSGEIELGLTTFTDEAATPTPASRLLVRGEAGVFDGKWADIGGVRALDELNALLNALLQPAVALPEETTTPQSTTVATPTP